MKVLITGASSGIGKDLATEFAKLKYDLILVARTENKLIDLKEEITKKYNVNVEYYIADLSNENECIKLYERYLDIDILVNNAGFGDFGFFSETDMEKELKYFNQIIFKKDEGNRYWNNIKCCINCRFHARPTYGHILCYKKLCCKII